MGFKLTLTFQLPGLELLIVVELLIIINSHTTMCPLLWLQVLPQLSQDVVDNEHTLAGLVEDGKRNAKAVRPTDRTQDSFLLYNRVWIGAQSSCASCGLPSHFPQPRPFTLTQHAMTGLCVVCECRWRSTVPRWTSTSRAISRPRGSRRTPPTSSRRFDLDAPSPLFLDG